MAAKRAKKTGRRDVKTAARERHAKNTQLTSALAKELVELRRSSRLFDTQIALKCGIADATLRTWVSMGLAEDAREPHLSFAKDYSDASIDVEQEALEDAKRGDNGKEGGDWKAAAWFLERYRPCRWGKERVPLGGPREALDVQQLIEATTERKRTLTELLNEPPPELVSALVACKERVLALLAEQTEPALPDAPKP